MVSPVSLTLTVSRTSPLLSGTEKSRLYKHFCHHFHRLTQLPVLSSRNVSSVCPTLRVSTARVSRSAISTSTTPLLYVSLKLDPCLHHADLATTALVHEIPLQVPPRRIPLRAHHRGERSPQQDRARVQPDRHRCLQGQQVLGYLH
jgi:hypothetical protein